MRLAPPAKNGILKSLDASDCENGPHRIQNYRFFHSGPFCKYLENHNGFRLENFSNGYFGHFKEQQRGSDHDFGPT